jgi:hypothetical protein
MTEAENLQTIITRLDTTIQKMEAAALRLVLDRDVLAGSTRSAAMSLATAVEETRLLAAEDRIQISRLILLVQRLTQQGEDALAGTQRLEKTANRVAQDLAADRVRADEAPPIPGAGADAALRSPGPGETAAEVAAHDEEVIAHDEEAVARQAEAEAHARAMKR